MLIRSLFEGALLGFCIAAPVGPIGLLCFRRSLQNGFRQGLWTGAGAATADLVYGLIAAFGLAGLSAALGRWSVMTNMAGACVLSWVALAIIRQPLHEEEARPGAGTAWAGTFVLTLANPLTIASFGALFASAGATLRSASPPALAAGVFAGSMAWWTLLAAGATLLRHRIGPSTLVRVTRLAGFALLLYAARALALSGKDLFDGRHAGL